MMIKKNNQPQESIPSNYNPEWVAMKNRWAGEVCIEKKMPHLPPPELIYYNVKYLRQSRSVYLH